MIDRFGHALAAWILAVNGWTALLVACALLTDRLLARRARASLRMALYAPAVLRVVLPLSWSLPFARVPQVVLLLPSQAVTGSAAPAASDVPWYTVLAIGCAAVTIALVLQSVVRRATLARALASLRPLTSVAAARPVFVHRELGPMVVGLVAPRVVLPEALVEGATREALACILRHEIAHIRRGDPWLSAASELLLAVAWPVLPLWLAASRVRHLMELACDEAALADADAAERRRYGHVLLDVAEQQSLSFAGAGALHFGSTLRARIEALALQRPWPLAVQAAAVAVAVAALAACSSAGPTSIPQTTGSSRAASTSSLDQYGYQFENDPATAKAPLAASGERDPANPRRLPPEVIQSVVRQSFGSLLACYEGGLKGNPKLQGTAEVKFTIDPNGLVQDAADSGSILPDANVVACVVKGFSALSFPPPQDGYVTVVYPIVFSP
jgi:beta-lactamase regulating signal transducer with metallopeptidase domain